MRLRSYNKTSLTTKGTKFTMPTFNKAFNRVLKNYFQQPVNEVGIVPISIICFMVNRHKKGKNKILV